MLTSKDSEIGYEWEEWHFKIKRSLKIKFWETVYSTWNKKGEFLIKCGLIADYSSDRNKEHFKETETISFCIVKCHVKKYYGRNM